MSTGVKEASKQHRTKVRIVADFALLQRHRRAAGDDDFWFRKPICREWHCCRPVVRLTIEQSSTDGRISHLTFMQMDIRRKSHRRLCQCPWPPPPLDRYRRIPAATSVGDDNRRLSSIASNDFFQRHSANATSQSAVNIA
jgi:hypothetical protein